MLSRGAVDEDRAARRTSLPQRLEQAGNDGSINMRPILGKDLSEGRLGVI